MLPDFGRGFRRKCAQGWLLASLGIAGMKREGIFMVGDHLVGERANSGESERSTASSLASISYRSPRPAAPPAKMPAFARLLGYIANMKQSMTTAMAAPIRIAMERRGSLKRTRLRDRKGNRSNSST